MAFSRLYGSLEAKQGLQPGSPLHLPGGSPHYGRVAHSTPQQESALTLSLPPRVPACPLTGLRHVQPRDALIIIGGGLSFRAGVWRRQRNEGNSTKFLEVTENT